MSERSVTRPAVAAFDFDGTLSPRDNFVPFLRRVAGTSAVAGAFAAGAVHVAKAGRAHWSRNGMKAELLQQLVGGRDAADLDDTARTFAADVLARHLRSEAVKRADWHRTQGHRLVIVSASLAVYLRPIAERLRFDAVLATELEVGTTAVSPARCGARTCANPRRRAASTSGSHANCRAPTRSYGPTATAPATMSCGHAPTAPCASAVTRTRAPAPESVRSRGA